MHTIFSGICPFPEIVTKRLPSGTEGFISVFLHMMLAGIAQSV
jgi:hypothetical protein